MAPITMPCSCTPPIRLYTFWKHSIKLKKRKYLRAVVSTVSGLPCYIKYQGNSLNASCDLAVDHLAAVTTSCEETSAMICARAWMRRRVFSRPAVVLVKLANCCTRDGCCGCCFGCFGCFGCFDCFDCFCLEGVLVAILLMFLRELRQ